MPNSIRKVIPYFLFLCLLFIENNFYGQNIISTPEINRMLYFGVSSSIAKTHIQNYWSNSIIQPQNSEKLSISGSIEIGHRFSKIFSFSSGICFNTYSSESVISRFTDSLTNVYDEENEIYIRRILGKDIVETEYLGLLSVPILSHLHTPLFGKTEFFIQAGFKISFPIIKKYSSSGIMSYSGYYPAYKLEIFNVEHEGFFQDISVSAKGELKTKKVYPEFYSSVGLAFVSSENIKINLGIFYSRILSEISNYSLSEQYHLTSNKDEIKSFMGNSSKVTAYALGIKIGLIFYIK